MRAVNASTGVLLPRSRNRCRISNPDMRGSRCPGSPDRRSRTATPHPRSTHPSGNRRHAQDDAAGVRARRPGPHHLRSPESACAGLSHSGKVRLSRIRPLNVREIAGLGRGGRVRTCCGAALRHDRLRSHGRGALAPGVSGVALHARHLRSPAGAAPASEAPAHVERGSMLTVAAAELAAVAQAGRHVAYLHQSAPSSIASGIARDRSARHAERRPLVE